MENRTARMGFTDLCFRCIFLSLLRSLDEQEARCSDGIGGRRRSRSVPYLDLIKQLIFRSLACSSQKSKEDGNSSAECEK